MVSTVHRRNAIHQYEQIEIADRFLAYARENNLVERYHKIIEYLFIEVFTRNIFSILIEPFDGPDFERLTLVRDDLKKGFPNWNKNKIYNEWFSKKEKPKMNLLMTFPVKVYAKIVIQESLGKPDG